MATQTHPGSAKTLDGAQANSLEQWLFESRTLLLFGEINMAVAEVVSAQLLALAAESDAPIRMVVHSPGGHVESADTLFDLVRAISAPVYMLGSGCVAGAGALHSASAQRSALIAAITSRPHQPHTCCDKR